MDEEKLLCEPVTIKWSVADIIKELEDNDLEATEEAVARVMDYIDKDRLEEVTELNGIESGWLVIQSAVEDYIKYDYKEN